VCVDVYLFMYVHTYHTAEFWNCPVQTHFTAEFCGAEGNKDTVWIRVKLPYEWPHTLAD
jgi:hypothetical protein